MSENPATAYSRLQTAQAIIRVVQSMIPPMDQALDVFDEYWDIAGAVPFTDEELVSIGITADQLGTLVTVVENYQKFMVNDAPAAIEYKAALNMARRLSA